MKGQVPVPKEHIILPEETDTDNHSARSNVCMRNAENPTEAKKKKYSNSGGAEGRSKERLKGSLQGGE